MSPFDIIIPLEQRHAEYMVDEFPEVEFKICRLTRNVPDPYGMPLEDYREKRDMMSELIKTFLQSLTSRGC